MTDRARELVKTDELAAWLSAAMHESRVNEAGQICLNWLDVAPLERIVRYLNRAADFIEQSLTPPEGDTVSEEVEEAVAQVLKITRGAIAAIRSRVSPQAGMRESQGEKDNG